MALKFDYNLALSKYLENNKTNFRDSLKQVLKFITEDPNISNVKIASYLLATSKIEADYSLQRWEGDYLCASLGKPLYPPCQKALDYYRSTKGGKKNYYELGVDPLGVPYYGRGMIQLTGKSQYQKYGGLIGVDLIKNPKLALDSTNSYQIASLFFKERVNVHIISGDLTRARKAVNGGTREIDKINYTYKIWMDILESLSPNENGGDQNQNPNYPSNDNNEPPLQNDPPPIANNDSQGGQDRKSNGPIINSLIQMLKPQISPTEIDIDVAGFSDKDKIQIQKGLGNVPFIWYNGYQITYTDIRSLNLFHKDILPMMKLIFVDSLGLMKNDGFPTDDTIITIFLSSRSNLLRSIKMDFKILNFKDCGEGLYAIDGICDVPEIYLHKFNSYSKKTSLEALMDIAKECGLGFCSNIQNTEDRMTWINPGLPRYEFIKNIIKNSYTSDNSFMYCYVDYYYNLCYMDISKEIDRDISADRMIDSFGFSSIQSPNSGTLDERDVPLLLSNEKSFIGSVAYFDTYEILNKSTRVSLKKTYLNRSKIYNSNNKELLIFDVDSITTDGNKSIIMKAKPGDNKFFSEHTTSIWLGKQDSDQETGNVHKNYNYSIIQNKQNLDDLSKVATKIKLSTPNYNIYKYQKVPILFSAEKRGPTYEDQFYKRLSGDWIVSDISYEFDSKSLIQIITLVKRELSLTEEESKNISVSKEKSSNDYSNDGPLFDNPDS